MSRATPKCPQRYWLFAVLLLLSLNLYSVESAGVVFTLSQPDGYEFEAVQKGNRYLNWIETVGGYSIVQYQGVWYYASKDEQGRLVADGERVGACQSAESAEAAPIPKQIRQQHIRPDLDVKLLRQDQRPELQIEAPQ